MKVKVIIPLYKNNLSTLEKRSLRQAYTVLSGHPLAIIKPEKLDVTSVLKEFPKVEIISFKNEYFDGIAGYNQLMLSTELYARFLDYDYMLIHQLDAYVFQDDLLEWCSKGYDYIGAPWLKKPVYQWPLVRQYMSLLLKISHWLKKPNKQMLWNRVGNGGLSLRKVKSHHETTLRLKDKINFYLEQERSHFYNEDVFWGTEVNRNGIVFSYPDAKEALGFAFDKYPSLCYKMNGNKLPFGCHSWYKRKMKKFWKPIIGF